MRAVLPFSARRTIRGALAGVLVLSLGATACGSGLVGDDRDASRTANLFEAALGERNPAQGEPVLIGMILDAGGDVEETAKPAVEGARMAVAWANDYRGGVAGRPIELLMCENQGTPAGAQSCAEQMVEKRVAAVVTPYSAQGPAQLPVITKAGIPYLTLAAVSMEDMTTQGVFALSSGYPGILGASAVHARSEGLKKFSMIVSDMPSAVTGAEVLGGLVFKNAGIDFDVIPAPVGSSDLTAQLRRAVDRGADAVGITGEAALCTSFLDAVRNLGLTQQRYVTSTCLDERVVRSFGREIEGSIVVTTSASSPKESALYAAMTRTYAPQVHPYQEVSNMEAAGATVVLALVNVMEGSTGEVDAGTVLQQLKTKKDVSLPFSGGLTFTCDGTAVPLLKNVCSAQGKTGVVTSAGRIIDLNEVDSTSLFKGA